MKAIILMNKILVLQSLLTTTTIEFAIEAEKVIIIRNAFL